MMSNALTQGYRRGAAEEKARVIVEMPKDELVAIDEWGVPAGMPSRTATIRMLIQKGLEAVSCSGTGGGQTAGNSLAG
jgi:hypothetical protein